MNTKQIIGIMVATGMVAFAGSGCVSHRAESPFHPELTRPNETAIQNQPYSVEEVHLTIVADQIKQLEALEKENKGFTARLNGWLNGQDFSANARAAKEAVLDRIETMKVVAAANFDVDESDVTMPMLAFFEGFLLSNEDEDLAEMGLPDLKMDKEADIPRIRNPLQRNSRTTIVQSIFGSDAGNGEKMTAQLARRYPGLFGENGTGLRIFVAIWDSSATWVGRYGDGEDSDYRIGVWVVPSDKLFHPEDTFSAPGFEFDAASHYGCSMIGLTGSQRTFPKEEQLKGNAKQKQEFFMDRLCAAIVEAINLMSAK